MLMGRTSSRAEWIMNTSGQLAGECYICSLRNLSLFLFEKLVPPPVSRSVVNCPLGSSLVVQSV